MSKAEQIAMKGIQEGLRERDRLAAEAERAAVVAYIEKLANEYLEMSFKPHVLEEVNVLRLLAIELSQGKHLEK